MSSAMLQMTIDHLESGLHEAREAVRGELGHEVVAIEHVRVVEMVAGELLSAAYESRVRPPVVLTVETFARIMSVRVRCPEAIELRDEPFGLRERVLQGLTLAFGQRHNADGTADLWAEIPRAG